MNDNDLKPGAYRASVSATSTHQPCWKVKNLTRLVHAHVIITHNEVIVTVERPSGQSALDNSVV